MRMQLNIHDQVSLADLQNQFSKSFPYLKIEFYRHPHQLQKGSRHADQIDTNKKIMDVQERHAYGILEFKDSDTTGHVESLFSQKFGLNVQIFRKGNNCWIQTLNTDYYTLNQQSEISKAECAISPSTSYPPIEDYDFT